MKHQDDHASDAADGVVDALVEAEFVDDRELASVIAPAAGQAVRADSPYVAAQPLRVSAEVLTAADPAAALAARLLLRQPNGTRRVYTTGPTHWFAFARQLGVEPLHAKIAYADAHAMFARKEPVRVGRPLAPSTVQLNQSARSSFYRYAVKTGVLTESAYRIIARLARETEIPAAADISPHSLLHSFATAALAGVELREVQDALGRAEPRTTRCDRSRHNLYRHAAYTVAALLADSGVEWEAVGE